MSIVKIDWLQDKPCAYFKLMRKGVFALVALGILGSSCGQAVAQVTLAYRERTGTAELGIKIREELVPGGSVGHSLESNGDVHDVQMDGFEATTHYFVESPSLKIAYTVTRKGEVLIVQGTLSGASISKTIPIDGRPWYQSIERSLRDYVVTYALTGAKRPLTFWIVHPWEAKAYLLQARVERLEPIKVNDRQVTAVRIRVSPTGILALFWSSLYWYRPSDGRFVRYEAVRGPPGTAKSVVEYMGND